MQLALEQQLEEIRIHLIDCLSIDFVQILVTEEIEDWPTLSWNEFSKELQDQEIDLNTSLNRNWQFFFNLEKEKYNLVKLFLSSRKPFKCIANSFGNLQNN
ncbi:MAG TPA: hypothetical protein VD908_02125 [Cytophagales bacterium]|nr:hypothetical protein [Cytophagales bacterium]